MTPQWSSTADGACVVVVPSDGMDDEHCTVIYLGDIEAPSMSLSAAFLTAKTLAGITVPFASMVTKHTIFGPPDDRVWVAELEIVPELADLRGAFERFNNSEFPQFRPHITEVGRLRRVGTPVMFNRMAVWYGEERFCWLLGSNRMVAA